MDRVDRVLLTLEPVARNLAEDDLDEAIAPGERFPHWYFRCRERTHIRPQQPGAGLDRIGLDRDAVFEVGVWMGDLFKRLVDAFAGVVELPAVIVAA